MGGVTAGDTIVSKGGAGYVGGEVSVVRLRDGNWFGFYGDAYRDFGVDATYTTGGLELGHRFFGVDGGAALRLVDGAHQPGATARLCISAGVLTIYARYAYFDSGAGMSHGDHVLQIGGSFKLPLHSPFGG